MKLGFLNSGLGTQMKMGTLMAGGGVLPFSQDFSALGDGALPSIWKGSSTITISSGQAVNSPTLGSELLTNGNMETGDPPSSWTAGASGTLSSAADERTGGAGAASINIARNGVNNPYAYQAFVSANNRHYKIIAWMKKVDASHGPFLYCANADIGTLHETNTAWARYLRSFVLIGGSGAYQVRLGAINTSEGTSVRHDDASLKEYINVPDLFKAIDAEQSLVRVGINITLDQYGDDLGVVCCLDDPTNPQNYVAAKLGRYRDYVRLIKCVNGTVSVVLIETAVTYSAGAALEIRHTATNTFQVWYNGVQVSTDKTISDASIVDNTYHGIFETDLEGAGGVDAFFCESV